MSMDHPKPSMAAAYDQDGVRLATTEVNPDGSLVEPLRVPAGGFIVSPVSPAPMGVSKATTIRSLVGATTPTHLWLQPTPQLTDERPQGRTSTTSTLAAPPDDRRVTAGDDDGKSCDTVNALAAIWADHPDYQETWKP